MPTNHVKTIATQCLAARARVLNRVVTRIYDDAMRPLGITVSQMNILVVVAAHDVIRLTEIGSILQMDASTLSRNLERVKKNGWVAAAASQDARAHPIRTTAAGRRLLKKAYPPWQQAQRSAEKQLGNDIVQLLKDIERHMKPGLFNRAPEVSAAKG